MIKLRVSDKTDTIEARGERGQLTVEACLGIARLIQMLKDDLGKSDDFITRALEIARQHSDT